MKASFIVAVILLLIRPLFAEGTKQVFDLKKSIEFAVKNSPDFDSLNRELSIAELEKDIAGAKFLPSLDLNSVHGVQDSTPRTTGPWASEVNLELTENLYDNGVSQTNFEIASLKKQKAEYVLRERKNKLSLDIINQFIIYSLNVKLLDIQEKQVKLVNKQFNLISKDYYQGIKTKNNFLRFKTQVSRNEIDLLNSKNTVLKSKLELERLIGVSFLSNENIEFIPLALEGSEVYKYNGEWKIEDQLLYKSAELQKKVNTLDTDLIRRKKYPELNLAGAVSYGSSQYLGTGQSFEQNDRVNWSGLLTIKYNIFDWGIRTNDFKVALERNNILDNGLRLELLELKSNIGQFEINIDQVNRNYELAKELLALEKNNIDFVEVEYRNGKIQYLDLVSGLNNFTDAQIKFYTAASDLQLIKFTSLYYQGNLYEELFK